VDVAEAIDFHGIPITLSYEPFAGDAFTTLFAGFDYSALTTKPLRVELHSSPTPVYATLAPEWSPTFCHGLVQGYSRDGAHVLSDGESQLEVFPRSGRMSGAIFERAQPDLFAGMQHIALSLLLRERGIFDLHAATACSDQRAWVILGDSGAGKTTLLLSLMELGCDFLGDDRLLFRTRSERTELLAYPRAFHASQAALQIVGKSPAQTGAKAVAGKYAIEPLEHWPQRFRRSYLGPLDLILPQIEDRALTSVERATPAEAFGKLLSSSATVAVEAIDRRAEQMQALKALADSADAYDVRLGRDLLTQPSATARRILDAMRALAREP